MIRIIFFIIMITPMASLANVFEIADAKMFPIDHSEEHDLSGLSLCKGKLLSVSDKHKDSVFVIEVQEDSAKLKKYSDVTLPEKYTPDYKLIHRLQFYIDRFRFNNNPDFEGIACSNDRENIYILSENRVAFTQVNSGPSKQWIGKALYKTGVSQGYFNKYNAFLEGITLVNDNHIILAVEREPRGLVFLKRQSSSSEWLSEFKELPNNLKIDFHRRSMDVTGLENDGRYLYTLERNASAVCRREINSLMALDCISFYGIEQEQGYENQSYGLSEGLAMDDQFIYVVFDNNGQSRMKYSNDYRGVLLVMRRPENWVN